MRWDQFILYRGCHIRCEQNSFTGKWSAMWKINPIAHKDDQDLYTTEPIFDTKELAKQHAMSQIKKLKLLELTKEKSTPRRIGYYRAPWGDIYDGRDLENGLVPLEAEWEEEIVEE